MNTQKKTSLAMRMLTLTVTVGTTLTLMTMTKAEASSWSPTLLVNTEAFQVIDFGDGTVDIQLQFGASTQTIKFLTNGKFEFSRGVKVQGNLSGSSLNIDRNATVGGSLTATGSIRTKNHISGSTLHIDKQATFGGPVSVTGSLRVRGSISGAILRVTTNADIHGALTVTGAIRSDNNITLNDDADNSNVILTFGSDTTNETLTWLNTADKFQFSDDVSVVGSISGSLLRIDGNADVHGALTASGSFRTDSNITLNDDADNSNVILTFGSDTTNETITWLNTADKFYFSDDVDIAGTISGTTLKVWGAGPHTFSGSVSIEGALSGSTFYGAGLGDCSNGTSHKLLYNVATGRFGCGTDQSGGTGGSAPEIGTESFSGAVLRMGDNRYVKKQGDTMTGALTIDLLNTTTGTGLILREKAYFGSSALLSGTLILQNIQGNTPLQAAPGMLKTYSEATAGRGLFSARSQFGSGYALQPALFSKMVMGLITGGGTTVNGYGTTVTNDTTVSHPAADQVFGYMTNFATAATNNDTAGTSSANTTFFRGSAGVANGFFFSSRVGVVDTASIRTFVGLANQTIATMVGADNPTGVHAGFQFSTNRADTGWQFETRDGSTQNVVNTGMAFNANQVYQLSFYCSNTCTSISWEVDNLTLGTSARGSTSSNLPTGSTAMRQVLGVSTLTTAVKNIRMQHVYTEADR